MGRNAGLKSGVKSGTGVPLAALLAGAVAVAPLAGPSVVQAQGSGMVLEEILVTAQKREESLQETPIAITAFTAAAIEKFGVTNIGELTEFAPNVVFSFTAPVSGASNAATVFIRGIGQTDFALTTEAGVGTYVDGIYMSRSLGGVLDVLDVARIEILRGPQGTLFGRNTIGGAINITSARPNDEFGGNAEFATGDHGRIHVRSSVNVPIADRLYFRVAASSKHRNGTVHGRLGPDQRNIAPEHRTPPPDGITTQTDLGNENRSALRGSLLYEASPDFSALLTADYAVIRENNAPAILLGTTSTLEDGPVAFVYNAFEAPGRTLPGFANAFYTDANFVTGDKKTTFATGPNGTHLDAWGLALTLEWKVLDALTIKSLTAYRKTDGFFNRDADGSPLQLTHTQNYGYEHKQFSEELQFIGSVGDNRLRYAAGVYYFTEKGHDPLFVGFPESFGSLYLDKIDIDNKSIAGYAQATFQIFEPLAITGGVRYTRDKKKFFTDQFLVTGTASQAVFGAPPGTVVPLVPRNSLSEKTFTNVSPRVSLEFQALEDLLAYASYSQGFKSGGFNMRYVQPRDKVLPFDPEKVEAFEVGLKWEGFDRRLRLNGAAFFNKYKDVQVTVYENLGAPVTLNSGEAEIKGFEVELMAVPLQNLQLSGGLGYLDAKYTKIRQSEAHFATPEQEITLASKLPKAPKWQATAALDYTLPLLRPEGGDMGRLEFHGDWVYSAALFNDAQNSRFLHQSAFHLFNAGVSYVNPSDSWRLRFFVENLTDKRVLVSGDSNFGIGFHEGEYNRPREWGVAFRVNF